MAKVDVKSMKPSAQERSGIKITEVQAYRLRLPYKGKIDFRSVSESTGQYVILRIKASDGSEGIGETVARPGQQGEDAIMLAHQIDTFFKDQLIGEDPLAHLSILDKIDSIKACRSVKALIDLTLWDLKGKVLGQPVWRLLGGSQAKTVPLSWIAHGFVREQQVAQAKKMAQERGYKGMKLKTWKRSMEDVRLVEDVRKALGDKTFIYVDGNGSYLETEARTILAKVADYNVAFIEEPCSFTDPMRQAAMAAALPVALLGDQCCTSLEAVHNHIRIGSIGAVSVKLRRTGMTESLKIIGLAEAAGIPAVIGTDSESRIGSMARMHLRSAIPSLDPYPTETHFFDKLGDDVFAGEFGFNDGTITPTDAPGFGAGLDMAKVEKYAF